MDKEQIRRDLKKWIENNARDGGEFIKTEYANNGVDMVLDKKWGGTPEPTPTRGQMRVKVFCTGMLDIDLGGASYRLAVGDAQTEMAAKYLAAVIDNEVARAKDEQREADVAIASEARNYTYQGIAESIRNGHA